MATATQNRTPQESRIRELAVASTPLEVDEEKCIVKGVKILGERSINPPPDNNIYPQTVREKAIAVLEGARAHVDHWKDEPSYKDSFGVHRNVRESGSGLMSDVHCNPHHPITKQFLWDARNNPRNVGFSLNTTATKRWTEDGMIVESINFSPVHHSVDLVHHGATTASLHESAKNKVEPMTIANKKVRDILVARTQPWQVKAFAKLREAAEDLMGADVAIADPAATPEAPAELSPDEQAKAAFKAMVMAVWEDESLTWEQTLDKIYEIAEMQEQMLAESEASASEAVAAAAEAAKGRKPPVATPVKPDKSKTILDVLTRESVQPTVYLTRALAGCETEAEMRDTIKDYKARIKEQASGAPVAGSRTTTQEPPAPATCQEAARTWCSV